MTHASWTYYVCRHIYCVSNCLLISFSKLIALLKIEYTHWYQIKTFRNGLYTTAKFYGIATSVRNKVQIWANNKTVLRIYVEVTQILTYEIVSKFHLKFKRIYPSSFQFKPIPPSWKDKNEYRENQSMSTRRTPTRQMKYLS